MIYINSFEFCVSLDKNNPMYISSLKLDNRYKPLCSIYQKAWIFKILFTDIQ